MKFFKLLLVWLQNLCGTAYEQEMPEVILCRTKLLLAEFDTLDCKLKACKSDEDVEILKREVRLRFDELHFMNGKRVFAVRDIGSVMYVEQKDMNKWQLFVSDIDQPDCWFIPINYRVVKLALM